MLSSVGVCGIEEDIAEDNQRALIELHETAAFTRQTMQLHIDRGVPGCCDPRTRSVHKKREKTTHRGWRPHTNRSIGCDPARSGPTLTAVVSMAAWLFVQQCVIGQNAIVFLMSHRRDGPDRSHVKSRSST